MDPGQVLHCYIRRRCRPGPLRIRTIRPMQAEWAAREQGLEPEGGLSLTKREYIALEPVPEQDFES
jgi:hypothetical protein